ARGPPGAGDEILKPRVLGVDVLLTRHRADLTLSLVVQPDRTAVEGECARGEIHHRPEHPVEIEGGADLPADLEDECDIFGALTRAVHPGVAEGEGGDRGQRLHQLPVLAIENDCFTTLL